MGKVEEAVCPLKAEAPRPVLEVAEMARSRMVALQIIVECGFSLNYVWGVGKWNITINALQDLQTI